MPQPKPKANETKNVGGRPPKFTSARQLQDKCDRYFEYIRGEYHEEERIRTLKDGSTEPFTSRVYTRPPEPPTVTGLTLFLGFASKASLYNYKGRREYAAIIKRALMRIEHGYELALFGQWRAGAVFALKNMGWSDRQQHEIGGTNGEPIKIEQVTGIKVE